MTKGYIVSGTDTGVGKTVFSAALTSHLRACYWKPVQAGLDEISDSDFLRQLATPAAFEIVSEAYRLTTPCSPHQAAAIDNVMIDPARLTLPQTTRPLVVEGAGGVLVPLSDKLLFADMFATWALPVILVARTTLGTINHSLMSVEILQNRGISVHGMVFMGDENTESEHIICAKSGARHLGRIPFLPKLDHDHLMRAFAQNIRTEFL